MSFFSLEEVCAITGGSWVVEPDSVAQEFSGVSIDTRSQIEGGLFVALPGTRSDGHDWLEVAAQKGALAALVEQNRVTGTPSSTFPMIAVEDTARALWRLAEAWRDRLTARTIAITGSSGKTTVRRMLQAILEHANRLEGVGSCTASERSFNNHLGVPLTILRARLDDRFLVLEVGTNAPGEIAELAALARPDLAIITNVGRVHLEGLGSLEGVAAEKASLLGGLSAGDFAIVPSGGGPLSNAIQAYLRQGVEPITVGGPGADVALAQRRVLDQTGAQILRLEGEFETRLRLAGAHNAQNALSAIAAARSLGIADKVIGEALAELGPDSMRLAVEDLGDTGIMLFNDAYNANPDAVLASLDAFAEVTEEASRRVVILGDMLELGDEEAELHREIGRAISQLNERVNVEVVILIGERSRYTAEALVEAGFENLIIRISELSAELIESVAAIVQDGDAVLIKASRAVALERLVEMVRLKNTNQVERELTQKS